MEMDAELSMQIEQDILDDLVNRAARHVGENLTEALLEAEITMEETGPQGWAFRGPGFVKRLKEEVMKEVERKLGNVRFRK